MINVKSRVNYINDCEFLRNSFSFWVSISHENTMTKQMEITIFSFLFKTTGKTVTVNLL